MDVQFGDPFCATQFPQWGPLKQEKKFWISLKYPQCPKNVQILGVIFLILGQGRRNFLLLSLSGSKNIIFL